MKNIIGKGINRKNYFSFSWGYFYYSVGYFFYTKTYIPIFNEFNKLIFATCSGEL